MTELLQHFESFPTGIQEDVINKLIGKNINNIEKQIKSAEQKKINDESKANKAGFELYKNTQTDLKNIQSVLSKTDLKYQLIADKIADELIDCSITYFNKYHVTSTDPGDDTLKLFNYAKVIAVGDKIKEKLSNNEPTIKEYVNDKPKRKKFTQIIKKF